MRWFHPKNKNKRVKREQVLDVKLSSRRARAFRGRTVLAALTVSLVVLSGLWFLWQGGQKALEGLFYHNQAFALRTFDLQTDGVIPLEKLRQWSGVKPGDSLLTLDLGQIKRDLELVPLIKKAAVERVFPSTLIVRITEREPIARARVLVPRPEKSGYDIAEYYLDEDGYAMLPLEGGGNMSEFGFGNAGLSILTGLSSADLRPGLPAESAQVFAALRLIQAFERSPMYGIEELSEIDLSTPEVLQVATAQHSQVTLGLDNFEVQLRRWRAIYDHSLKIGKGIARLDLSVGNNLPVLWAEACPEPPAPRLLPKPLHYRKKHV